MGKFRNRLPIDPKWGKVVKYYREKMGISQRKLGKITGISYSEISLIERGKENLLEKNLENILPIFDISFVEFAFTAHEKFNYGRKGK